MTRETFIDTYSPLLCGMIADAASGRATGGELAIKLRSWFGRIDALLGKAWDEAHGKQEQPKANGTPAPARAKT